MSGLIGIGPDETSGVIGEFPAQTGNQVLISTQTASDVSGVAFSSSLITDTYDDYMLDINSAVPVTNGTEPFIQMSIDNGSAKATVYTGRRYDQLAGTGSGHEHNDLAHMVLGTSISHTAADGGISSRVLFHDLRNASKWKHGSFFTSARHSSDRYAWQGGFECIATSAINWINFKFSAGNVSSGRFNLYGIEK
jgi:hypothetical protein